MLVNPKMSGTNTPDGQHPLLSAASGMALCQVARIGLMAALLLLAPATTTAQESAEAAFQALERRLLDAETVSFGFDIRAVGAVPAVLVGDADVGPREAARIVADGSFAGTEAAIRLKSDGEFIEGGNGTAVFKGETPPALREGLLVGLTRMGLLHNLALVSAGSPPDRTDGTVTDWVRYSDVTLGPEESVAGVTARRFSFTVVVAGIPSASAELWVDAISGLPIRRVQVVSFPEGEMRVLEQYSDFSADAGN